MRTLSIFLHFKAYLKEIVEFNITFLYSSFQVYTTFFVAEILEAVHFGFVSLHKCWIIKVHVKYENLQRVCLLPSIFSYCCIKKYFLCISIQIYVLICLIYPACYFSQYYFAYRLSDDKQLKFYKTVLNYS